VPFAVDEFAPGPLRTFGDPPVDVGALYLPTTAYIVKSLSQSERIRPRDQKVIPTVEVTFVVPGFAGVFTIRIDNYAFTHVDVLEYMRERSYLIRALYALPERSPPYGDVAALGGVA
jgi:hypothetical protein